MNAIICGRIIGSKSTEVDQQHEEHIYTYNYNNAVHCRALGALAMRSL